MSARRRGNLIKYFIPVILLAAAVLTVSAQTGRRAKADFEAFLAKADAAQLELQNGNASKYKALWSHAGDVTLSGGFGGTTEKGWTNVEKRLDWAASQFTKGENRVERLTAGTNGSLAYVVQLEHIKFMPPGQKQAAQRDYRVTLIFRKENGGWRILHRHADAQLKREGSAVVLNP